MSDIKYYVDLNLKGNQLLESSLERLSSHPTSYEGRIYYNTEDNFVYFYNGAAWIKLNTNGGWVEVSNKAARDSIASEYRALYMAVAYHTSGGGLIAQVYNGSDLTNNNWTNDANWKNIQFDDVEYISLTANSETDLLAKISIINARQQAGGSILLVNDIELVNNRTFNLNGITIDFNGYTINQNNYKISIKGSNWKLYNGTLLRDTYDYNNDIITTTFEGLEILGDADSISGYSSYTGKGTFERITFGHYIAVLSTGSCVKNSNIITNVTSINSYSEGQYLLCSGIEGYSKILSVDTVNSKLSLDKAADSTFNNMTLVTDELYSTGNINCANGPTGGFGNYRFIECVFLSYTGSESISKEPSIEYAPFVFKFNTSPSGGQGVHVYKHWAQSQQSGVYSFYIKVDQVSGGLGFISDFSINLLNPPNRPYQFNPDHKMVGMERGAYQIVQNSNITLLKESSNDINIEDRYLMISGRENLLEKIKISNLLNNNFKIFLGSVSSEYEMNLLNATIGQYCYRTDSNLMYWYTNTGWITFDKNLEDEYQTYEELLFNTHDPHGESDGVGILYRTIYPFVSGSLDLNVSGTNQNGHFTVQDYNIIEIDDAPLTGMQVRARYLIDNIQTKFLIGSNDTQVDPGVYVNINVSLSEYLLSKFTDIEWHINNAYAETISGILSYSFLPVGDCTIYGVLLDINGQNYISNILNIKVNNIIVQYDCTISLTVSSNEILNGEYTTLKANLSPYLLTKYTSIEWYSNDILIENVTTLSYNYYATADSNIYFILYADGFSYQSNTETVKVYPQSSWLSLSDIADPIYAIGFDSTKTYGYCITVNTSVDCYKYDIINKSWSLVGTLTQSENLGFSGYDTCLNVISATRIRFIRRSLSTFVSEVYESINGGITWSLINNDTNTINIYESFQGNNGFKLILTNGGIIKLYYSSNGGTSWSYRYDIDTIDYNTYKNLPHFATCTYNNMINSYTGFISVLNKVYLYNSNSTIPNLIYTLPTQYDSVYNIECYSNYEVGEYIAYICSGTNIYFYYLNANTLNAININSAYSIGIMDMIKDVNNNYIFSVFYDRYFDYLDNIGKATISDLRNNGGTISVTYNALSYTGSNNNSLFRKIIMLSKYYGFALNNEGILITYKPI